VYKPTFIINNSYQPGQTSTSNELRNIDNNLNEISDKHHMTDPGMQKKSSKRMDDNRQLTSSSSNNGGGSGGQKLSAKGIQQQQMLLMNVLLSQGMDKA
jgi:hypothetical protein